MSLSAGDSSSIDLLLIVSCSSSAHVLHACRPYAEKYAESQDAFFEDYTKAHLKLSELGVKWDTEPIDFEE